MRFQYFRRVVTLLASLAAFFAYVCRLNLSLIIEQMVFQDALSLKIQNDSTAQRQGLAEALTRMNSEDQSFRELSIGLRWQKQDMRNLAKKFESLVVNQTKRNDGGNKLKGTRPNESPFLFDISKEQQRGGTTDFKNRSSSTETSGEVDQVTRLYQQNLLNWNETQKNTLLGAYFDGYVIFQIPSGYAAEQFGAKILFMWMAIGTGATSILFPLSCKWTDGIWLPVIVRVIMGASQAGLFPAAYVLLCEWLPKTERSSWLAIPSAMARVGTIVMYFVAPLVLNHFGWEMVYYMCGGITLLWGVFFLIFGSNDPASSCWISKSELMYIEARMEPQSGPTVAKEQHLVTGSGFTINEEATKSVLRKAPINWLKLITNKPLLILSLVMFTSEWSNMLLLVKLPGFLGPALGMDLNEIVFWSSILIAIYCVQYPLSGICASKIEAAEFSHLNSIRIRKIFELLAHLMQAAGCLVIAFYNDKIVVIAALCLIMFGRATVGGGQCLMPPELSKDYPGSVMALANSIANSAGIFGPMVVSYLVSNPRDYNSWTKLWILSAGVFITGGILFCLFADNRPQNYRKKPKIKGLGPGISQAQLCSGDSKDNGAKIQVDEQFFKMDAFSRVGSEPSTNPARLSGRRATVRK